LKNNYEGDEDFYVFHSYNAVAYNNSDNVMYDRDLDFVIASPKKGLICIEVKAGDSIYYSGTDREWYYSSGRKMEHHGPYKQAAGAMRALRDKIEYNRLGKVRVLLDKCRFISAVCFVDMKKVDFLSQPGLPEEATIQLTILQDDLEHIWDKIEDIYKIKLPKEKYDENLSKGMNKGEFQLLLDSVMCPHFHLIPTPEGTNGIINTRLKKLVREQYRILDFLTEQQSAVINGAAGTGKTMIATEKARLHSMNGDKVLFLCFNKKLQKYLEDENKKNLDFENVDFRTISKLTKDKTGDFEDFSGLERWLDRCIKRETELGYKHIIIDEGQDFGVVDLKAHPEMEDVAIQNCEIINRMQEAVMEQGGTFYLFYDKYQTIQGGQAVENILPDCIENADCRLTLHKNCRNTKEIAKTSVTPIKDKNGKSLKVDAAYSWVRPYTPVMHVIGDRSNEEGVLKIVLDEFGTLGIKDVVILSQGALETSSIFENLIKSTTVDPYDYYKYNGKKYRVATCITFKGLEADGIVLLNLGSNSFSGERGKEFYVGTSRAKCKLDMICTLKDDDYETVVSQIDKGALGGSKSKVAMRKIFGSLFSMDVVVEDKE
jgi:hypothetical protein